MRFSVLSFKCIFYVYMSEKPLICWPFWKKQGNFSLGRWTVEQNSLDFPSLFIIVFQKASFQKEGKKAQSQTCHRTCQDVKNLEISWYFSVRTAVLSCSVPCTVKQTRELIYPVDSDSCWIFSLISGEWMDFFSIIFWAWDGGSEISLCKALT